MSNERRKVEWSLDFENMRVRAGQFVSDMMGETIKAKEARLQEKLAGAESGRIEIAFAVGRASISALDAASPNLFEAKLKTIGDYDYKVSGASERVISLRQKTDFPRDLTVMAGNAEELYWDIALAQSLPLRLKLTAGLGEADFDLSQLRIADIQLQTGVGKVNLKLPAETLAAEVRGGVGLTEVEIPAGASGNLDITGGVGEVRVGISADTAACLEAKAGLGAIEMPEGFVPVTDSGENWARRAWQTVDYATTTRQLSITLVGGVGRCSIWTFDTL